jgi:hypothetical protein
VCRSKACKSALGQTIHAVRASDLRSAGHRCQAVRTKLPGRNGRWVTGSSRFSATTEVFAPKHCFIEPDQRDATCPVLDQKIFPFPFDPNHLHIFAIPAHTGAFRDRHGRWAGDAVDAACQKTNDIARGRRSRVVLTPRRWRQVGERDFTGDGGKQARSPGRARNKPVNHRAGKAGWPGGPVVTNARAYYSTRAAAGATGTRLSLRPLYSEGGTFKQNSGASRGENRPVMPGLDPGIHQSS